MADRLRTLDADRMRAIHAFRHAALWCSRVVNSDEATQRERLNAAHARRDANHCAEMLETV